MQTAIVALIAALLASIIGPWVHELWVVPRALGRQKACNAYEVFMKDVDGLFENDGSREKIKKLYEQYHMVWLYADDSVVKGINILLRSGKPPMKAPKKGSPEWNLGGAILEMRKQNNSGTQLTVCDYLLVRS